MQIKDLHKGLVLFQLQEGNKSFMLLSHSHILPLYTLEYMYDYEDFPNNLASIFGHSFQL